MRRTPLKSRQAERDAIRRLEPGRSEWKTPSFGPCAACGRRGLLIRHHVLTEQRVRAAGGDPWDLRNALQLGAGHGCDCHRAHHSAIRRLPRSIVPPAAIAFAVEHYLNRFYR